MWILLFVLWLILNGRITVEILLFGAAIASVMTFFTHRVLKKDFSGERAVFRNIPLLLLYLLVLVAEILKAAAAVIKMVFRAQDPDPMVMEFHSGMHTHLQNVLLANSITLTPGTITVFQEDDHLVVHCLRREFADGIEDSIFIRLLEKMKF